MDVEECSILVLVEEAGRVLGVHRDDEVDVDSIELTSTTTRKSVYESPFYFISASSCF